MKEAREVIAERLEDLEGPCDTLALQEADSILSALDAAGWGLIPKEFVIGPHNDIKLMRAYLWDRGLVEDFDAYAKSADKTQGS